MSAVMSTVTMSPTRGPTNPRPFDVTDTTTFPATGTVTRAESLWPNAVATMTLVPAATPLTMPEPLTVATPGVRLTHVAIASCGIGLPTLSRTAPARLAFPPIPALAYPGVTLTPEGIGVTVTV